MKKFVAIAAVASLLVAAPALAFWGWDDNNGYGGGDYNGNGDFVGDGSAEGEATFSMTFTARGRTNADFRGTGDTNGNWSGYGYDQPYWYGTQPYGGFNPWIQQPLLPPAQAPAAQ